MTSKGFSKAMVKKFRVKVVRFGFNNDPFSGGRGTPLFFLVRLRERKRKVGKRGRRLVEKKKKKKRKKFKTRPREKNNI